MSLGGWLPGLSGQEAVWIPARPAVAPATARGVASETPSASLGRPVAVSRGVASEQSSALRPFPFTYRTAPLLKSPAASPNGIEPIATVAPPGTVIAASAPPVEIAAVPTTAVIEEGTGELFAAERDLPGMAMPRPLDVAALPVQHAPITKNSQSVPGPFGVPVLSVCDGMLDRMPGGLYFGAEYLLWWARKDHAPVLATTGDPQNGPLTARLGRADTIILDDGTLGRDSRSGARFTAGYYFDDCCTKAIEVSGFFLPQASSRFSASSAEFPVVARPFFSLNEGIERVQFVAFPGVVSGTLTVNSPSELWGIEANARCKWCCGCDYRVDVLAGLRFLDLRESLTITENMQFLPGVLGDPFNGTHVINTDTFATRNQFYGAQVGIAAQRQWGNLTLDGVVKVALGDTHQEVSIHGFQVFPPGTPNVDTRPGGLFALNSNIGTFSRERFTVVPEVGVTLGWYLTENVQVTVGYNFLYWSSVVRPGEQIDRNLDVNRIPNFFISPRPADVPGLHPGVLFKESDYWVQGLTFGVRIAF
jgi:hypothetical protein